MAWTKQGGLIFQISHNKPIVQYKQSEWDLLNILYIRSTVRIQ